MNASPPTHVGVIGLGAMGRGMAQSLRKAGYLVHVCDALPGAAEAFAKAMWTRQVTPLRAGGFPSDAWRRADDQVAQTRAAWLALRHDL